MNRLKKLFKYNEKSADVLIRFMEKKGLFSSLFNVLINAFCFVGRLFKRNRNIKEDFYTVSLLECLKYFNRNVLLPKNTLSSTVIVPVYNGLEHLKNLLPSLVSNTPKDTKVIIVDDNSPDKEATDYIVEYTDNHDNWCLIKNDKNLGFVGSVNKAMRYVDTDIAIWLNSDTVVPEGWINRMCAPFNSFEDFASATPFTNSGVTFSYPVFCENNRMVGSLEEVNRVFNQIRSLNDGIDDTYSSTGFCMAINMKAWKEVGELDEENFGKGYGEENDWCFRASRKGYVHKLVPNCFVEHRHGGSFDSQEKKKLQESHAKILQEKYPDIMNKDVIAFLSKDPWKVYRSLANILFSNDSSLIINGKEDDEERQLLVRFAEDIRKWIIIPCDTDENCHIVLESFSDIALLFDIIRINKVIISNIETDLIKQIESLRDSYDFELILKQDKLI